MILVLLRKIYLNLTKFIEIRAMLTSNTESVFIKPTIKFVLIVHLFGIVMLTYFCLRGLDLEKKKLKRPIL